MRYCFLTLTLIIFLKSLLFAGGENDSVTITPIEESDGWPRFLVDAGVQHLDMRFPCLPGIEDYGDTVVLSAVDTSVFPTAVYGISFHKDAEEVNDPMELFEEILIGHSSASNALLWHRISVDGDRYILDIITKSTRNRVYRKDRVIVTGHSVYFLFTIFFIGSLENHDYFAESFSVRAG